MTPRGDDPVFAAEMQAVTEARRKKRLPGDGKIDMGDGRRLYPCEARAERDALIAARKTVGWGENMWPTPITVHYHSEPSA